MSENIALSKARLCVVVCNAKRRPGELGDYLGQCTPSTCVNLPLNILFPDPIPPN
jgi:hypothetical protein